MKAPAVTAVSIPASVNAIEPAFFQLFPNATSIAVAAENQTYSTYNGMLFGTNDAGELTDLLLVPEGMEGAAVLPGSIASVPACVFSRCFKLLAIDVPTGDTASARFAARNGILYTADLSTLLAAPAGLGASASIAPECTAIAAGAFWGSTNLQTIVVAGNVETIAVNADFNPQAAATDEAPAFNPATVTNATVALTGDFNRAAWEAAGFTNFAEPAQPGETIEPVEGSGFAFDLLDDYTLAVRWQGEDAAPAAVQIPEYGMLDGAQYAVTRIADAGFAGQESIITVDMPSTVLAIGAGAFEGCANLQTPTLANSVATIGDRAFADTALLSLVLPTSLQQLGAEALSGLSGTTVVSLTEVPQVAQDALAGATGISLYVPYRADDDYGWVLGAPVQDNHLYPYGVSVVQEGLTLEQGQTADLFEGGLLKAPGQIEVSYAYKAAPISIDTETGMIEAKQLGTSRVDVELKLTVAEKVVREYQSKDVRLEQASNSLHGEEAVDGPTVCDIQKTLTMQNDGTVVTTKASAKAKMSADESDEMQSDDGGAAVERPEAVVNQMVQLSSDGQSTEADVTSGNYIFLQGQYVATSGALPTTDDANNTNSAKAGWNFDVNTRTLRVWSSEGVTVAALWSNADSSGITPSGMKYWAPLRASKEELERYNATSPEQSNGVAYGYTHFDGLGGNVLAVDTSELSGAVNMSGWFAGMVNLKDITRLRIPDGSKGGQVPSDIGRLLSYTGIETIPSSFYIPDGVSAFHCIFTSAEELRSVYDGFSVPDCPGFSISYTGFFMGCTSLTFIPGTLFDRILSANEYQAKWGVSTAHRISLLKMFCGCKALTSINDGFTLPEGRISSVDTMFAACDSLSYLPASLRLDKLDVSAANMFKANYGGTEKYENFRTYWAGAASEINTAMVPTKTGTPATGSTGYWMTNFGRDLVSADSVSKVELNTRRAQVAPGAWQMNKKLAVAADGTIMNPGIPYGSTYMFKGWFADEALTQLVFGPDAAVNERAQAPTSGKLYAEYVETSGALPTTDDLNNTNAAIAGWLFDTDSHELRIWSASGVTVAGLWTSALGSSNGGDNADGNKFWGPLRSTVEEMAPTLIDNPEDNGWPKRFHGLGGDVRSIDTTELSGALNMAGWFAGMYSLESIDNLRIPDGSKGGKIPQSVSRMLSYSSIKTIPASLYFPEGVKNFHCVFTGCTELRSINEGFSLPDAVPGSQVDFIAVFMGCHSLTNLPASLFSRIASAEDWLASSPESSSARNINLEKIACGCRLLETLPEGFSLPVDRVSTVHSAFAESHALTYLPSTFRLDGLTAAGVDSMFKANYGATEMYDGLVTYWAGNASEIDTAMVYKECSTKATGDNGYWMQNFGRKLMTDENQKKVEIKTRRAVVNPGAWKLEQTVLVAQDGTVQNPGVPYASPYMFKGWFADEEMTQLVFAPDAAADARVKAPASGALYAEYLVTSEALPTTDDPNNMNSTKAGWSFDPETGTLKIWSAPGAVVADLWPNYDGPDRNLYWGPLCSSEDELRHYEATTPEGKAFATKYHGLGGNIKAVDTRDLSGAASMSAWFAGMDQLENIAKLKIPDGAKATGGTPASLGRMLCYSSIESIPAGFFIPEGVTQIHCMFTCAEKLISVADSFSLPSTIKGSAGIFMGCRSLTALPSSLFSRVASAEGYMQANPGTTEAQARNILLNHAFCGCTALATIPEGFTLPKGRIGNTVCMFAECDSLTLLPASLRFDTNVTLDTSSFTANYKGTTKYDSLKTYWAGSAAEINTALVSSNEAMPATGATGFWMTHYGRDLSPIPTNTVTFFTQKTGLAVGWDYFMGQKDTSTNTVTIPKTQAQLEEVGYTFLGWYSDGDFLFKIADADATQIANPPANVYGRYGTIITYSLVLDFAGGDEVEYPTAYNVEANDIQLPNPTRAGYEFAGWTGQGITTPTVDLVIPHGSVGDRTYTANWTPITYTVKFQPGDGKGDVVTRQGTIVDTISVPDANEVTTRGYTLQGWSTAVEGNAGDEGINIGLDDLDLAVKDLYEKGFLDNDEKRSTDIYAQWETHPYTISLHMYANGEGTPATATGKVIDEEVDLRSIAAAESSFRLSGYAASGWTYNASLGDPNAAENASQIKATGKMTIDELLTWVLGKETGDIVPTVVDGNKVRTIDLYAIWQPQYGVDVPFDVASANQATFEVDMAYTDGSVKAQENVFFSSKTRQDLNIKAYSTATAASSSSAKKLAEQLFGSNLDDVTLTYKTKESADASVDEDATFNKFRIDGGSDDTVLPVPVGSLQASKSGEQTYLYGDLWMTYKNVDFSEALKAAQGQPKMWDSIADITWMLEGVDGTLRQYLFASADDASKEPLKTSASN